jgi:putative NADH-flavin reductase
LAWELILLLLKNKKMMKLLIFGATGRIGRHLLEQALTEGHLVTAFTRNKVRLDIKHTNLKIIEGDVLDILPVEQAVKGQDAVLCSLGAGSKGKIRSEGTVHIIHAMEQAGVRRFICQTTLGAGDSQGNLNFFWKYIMFGLFLKEAFADHQLQESYVKQSQLDWTIVRPGAFTNGPKTGAYRHGFPSSDKTIKLKISCADVAHFMLRQLVDEEYHKKTPGLSY